MSDTTHTGHLLRHWDRTCPACQNEFRQPFVCTTCGAEKLRNATIKTLEAENAALREDAERYRWLRDMSGRYPKKGPIAILTDEYGDLLHRLDFAELDAAINEARKA